MSTKKIGLFDTTAILVGGMIGSAIFSLSGITILHSGPAAILSWIIAAVILYTYGLQTAELSILYPESGGVFLFPAKTLGKNKRQGKFIGWLSSWAYIFGCIAGSAFSAVYVGIYLSVGFPALSEYNVIIAILTVLFAGVINLMNIQMTGKTNRFLTIGLTITLLMFVIISFTSGAWDSKNLTPFFSQGAKGSFGFMGSIPIAMVAYGAIVAASFMAGSIKNPKKNIPRSMSIAMAIVVTLYILVILAVLGLITSSFLQENSGMTYIPLYAAAFTKLASIPWLAKLISISATLALITTTLVVMALAAMPIKTAADSGVLPKVFSRTNKKTGVAHFAHISVIIVTALLASFPEATNLVVTLGSLCNAFVVGVICLTVIYARKKNPDIKTFRAPGGNLLPVATLLVIISSYIPDIIRGGWILWAWTIGYFLFGILIYSMSSKSGVEIND